MKVWGVATHRGREIVAARSQKEAARLMKVSLYFLRGWAAETGNKEELDLALGTPGVVFFRPDSDRHGPWIRLAA